MCFDLCRSVPNLPRQLGTALAWCVSSGLQPGLVLRFGAGSVPTTSLDIHTTSNPPPPPQIRAEDGRRVEGVDITPFISGLPGGRGTDAFRSDDASGSTSQAANIQVGGFCVTKRVFRRWHACVRVCKFLPHFLLFVTPLIWLLNSTGSTGAGLPAAAAGRGHLRHQPDGACAGLGYRDSREPASTLPWSLGHIDRRPTCTLQQHPRTPTISPPHPTPFRCETAGWRL